MALDNTTIVNASMSTGGTTMNETLDNPNELMVGIEDYIGTKLDWSQDNRGIILPIESLRIIYDYIERTGGVK